MSPPRPADATPLELAAGALQERGVSEQRAGLTADLAVSVFRIAFARWIAPGEQQSMRELQRDVLATLQALTSS